MTITYNKILCLLGSVFTIWGIGYKLEYGDASSIFNSYTYSVFPLIMLPLLYCFYRNNEVRVKEVCAKSRGRLCVILPSFFFALFMVLGYSFEKVSSLNLIIADRVQIAKSIFVLVAYVYFFFQCIAYLYYIMDHFQPRGMQVNPQRWKIFHRLSNIWDEHPCIFIFAIMLVAYIPLMLLSYPATFMGDTSSQIQQGYNIKEWTSEMLNLVSDGVYLNNHHPVAHTMLIHIFLVIGENIFGSYNIGIFLYAFVQMLAVIMIVSYVCMRMLLLGTKKRILVCIVAYYILAPRIQNYLFAVTKDVYFSACLLLFCIALYDMIRGVKSRKNYFLLVLASLGVILFRNEGVYTALATLVICFLLVRDLRKRVIFWGIGLLVLVFLYQNVVFPTFQITPSSTREMLSIPFQQTARYVKNYGEELTENEKETIGEIINVDELGELYNELSVDPVKETYNKLATKEELRNYFSVWLSMLKRHPLVYVEAVMNQKFHHFYPGEGSLDYIFYETSEFLMECTNENCKPTIITDFHYPQDLQTFRKIYEGLRESIWSLPILSTLLSSAAYTWAIFLLFFYGVLHKSKTAICVLVPQVVQLAMCLLGPVNGLYSRYVLPFVFCIVPVTIFCLLDISKKEEEVF